MNIENIYPLTPVQEGMYFQSQLKDQFHNIAQISFNFNGKLHIDILDEVVNRLVERHEALRTTFIKRNDKLLQVVLKSRPITCEYHDLSDHDKREEKIAQFKAKDKRNAFNLKHDPLLRVIVFKVSTNMYRFIWTHHHIIMDGWSFGILEKEFIEIYKNLIIGNEIQLKKPVPYKRYIEWFQNLDKQAYKTFWMNYLDKDVEPSKIPLENFNKPEPAINRVRRKEELVIPKQMTEKLKLLAVNENTSLYVLLLAIWSTLLSKYNLSDKVMYGVVSSGRPLEVSGIEKTIGLFINTLPFIISADDSKTFKELLVEAKENNKNINRYQYFSLSEMKAILSIRDNLYNHVFVYENYLLAEEVSHSQRQFNLGEFQFEATPNIDLGVVVHPAPSLKFSFQYNDDIHKIEVIQGIKQHLLNLINTILKNPSIILRDIELLSKGEVTSILNKLRGPLSSFPERTIVDHFEESVKKWPYRVAIRSVVGSLTYGTFNKKVNQLAWQILNTTRNRQCHIALILDRSFEMLIGIYAVLKTGNVYVPVDPEYPPERIRFIIDDCEPILILTNHSFDKIIHDCNGRAVIFMEDVDDKNLTTNLDVMTKPKEMAYLLYTSGSTGKPKGVRINHLSLMNWLLWKKDIADLNQEDIILHSIPYTFDPSAFGTFCWGLTGGSTFLLDYHQGKIPIYIAKVLKERKITQLIFTPTMLGEFVSYLENAGVSKNDFRELKSIFSGGEVLSVNYVKRFYNLLQTQQATVFNAYGPTETTIQVCSYKCPKNIDLPSIPIGRPINNCQLYILGEQEHILPMGVIGELCIGGTPVSNGYYKRPLLNTKKFINHKKWGKIYKSGDLVRLLPGGEIEFIGRRDKQIKIRGYRVELDEIASHAMRHEMVNQAVAIDVKDDKTELTHLILFFVGALKKDEQFNLRIYLREFLPPYMLPTTILSIKNIPVTTNDKIDYDSLRQIWLEQINNKTGLDCKENEVETKIKKIWEKILHKNVSINDDFFSIGGHSISAIRLASAISFEFKTKFAVKSVFQHPTIQAQAIELTNFIQKIRPIAISKVKTEAFYELSPAQFPIWLDIEKNNFDESYNISGLYRLEGALNQNVMRRVCEFLVNRHEVLRSIIINVDGVPKLKVCELSKISDFIQFIEIRSDDNGKRDLDQLVNEKLNIHFELEKGPLIRMMFFMRSKHEYFMALAAHHIIFDEWSAYILLKELLRIYEAMYLNTNNYPKPLKLQFKDIAAWQRNHQKQKENQGNKDYWKQKAKVFSANITLPSDEKRDLQSYDAEKVSFVFDEELMQPIKEIIQKWDVTLFSFMMAVWNIVVSCLTGKRDILIGSPIAGRNHQDLQNQIGLYLRMMLVGNRVSKELFIQEFVRNVKNEIIECMEYSDLPIHFSSPKPRNPGSRQLFNIGFTWHDFDLYKSKSVENSVLKITVEKLAYLNKVKTDVWLHGQGKTNCIDFTLKYRKSLYKPKTVDAWITLFKKTVKMIIDNPSSTISSLINSTKSHEMKRNEVKKKSNLNKFFKTKAAAIDLSNKQPVRESLIDDTRPYPLVLKPVREDVSLKEWAHGNLSMIEEKLKSNGAILFRDFNIQNVRDFDEIVATVGMERMGYTDQSSPRTNVGKSLYTSTDYPAGESINLHSELSYSNDWPMQILFYCFRKSESGGQTPIADTRRVLAGISEKTKNKFRIKGIKYERKLQKGLGLSWQEVYQTDSKEEVVAYLNLHNIDYKWINDDYLKVSWRKPAIYKHPHTQEEVWFNHGYFFNARQLGHLIDSVPVTPFNTYYGDGEIIEDSVFQELKIAFEESKIQFDWMDGDILLLDNMAMAHARTPYQGERKVYVGMNNPYSKFKSIQSYENSLRI